MDRKLKKLLYLSFDSELTDSEKIQLEDALKTSEELRNEKIQIEKLRGMIGFQEEAHFKTQFAERVMQRIDDVEKTETESQQFFVYLKHLFKPIAIIGAVAVILLTAFNLYMAKDVSLTSAFGIYEEREISLYETPLESLLGD